MAMDDFITFKSLMEKRNYEMEMEVVEELQKQQAALSAKQALTPAIDSVVEEPMPGNCGSDKAVSDAIGHAQAGALDEEEEQTDEELIRAIRESMQESQRMEQERKEEEEALKKALAMSEEMAELEKLRHEAEGDGPGLEADGVDDQAAPPVDDAPSLVQESVTEAETGAQSPSKVGSRSPTTEEKARILAQFRDEVQLREESLSIERMRQEKLMLEKLREKKMKKLVTAVKQSTTIDSRELRPLSSKNSELPPLRGALPSHPRDGASVSPAQSEVGENIEPEYVVEAPVRLSEEEIKRRAEFFRQQRDKIAAAKAKKNS
jgi:hypothetical protein